MRMVRYVTFVRVVRSLTSSVFIILPSRTLLVITALTRLRFRRSRFVLCSRQVNIRRLLLMRLIRLALLFLTFPLRFRRSCYCMRLLLLLLLRSIRLRSLLRADVRLMILSGRLRLTLLFILRRRSRRKVLNMRSRCPLLLLRR